MGFFDRLKSNDVEEKAEIMKGCSLDFAAGILDLFDKLDISTDEVDISEVIIMGMFIVNIAFFRNEKFIDKETQINAFHRTMDKVFIDEIYFKADKIKNSSQIEAFKHILSKNINSRYSKYDELLANDMANDSRILRYTMEAFCENIGLKQEDIAGFVVFAPLLLMKHLTDSIKIFNGW